MIAVLLYMQDCIILQLTLGWICLVSRYCVEEHTVYDVGLISFPTSSLCGFPTWSRCRPDVVANVEPLRHRPDIGPISFPTSGRHRTSVVFSRHRPDIESISARCRPDVVDDIWPTSSPRANMESARYQPTSADIGPI